MPWDNGIARSCHTRSNSISPRCTAATAPQLHPPHPFRQLLRLFNGTLSSSNGSDAGNIAIPEYTVANSAVGGFLKVWVMCRIMNHHPYWCHCEFLAKHGDCLIMSALTAAIRQYCSANSTGFGRLKKCCTDSLRLLLEHNLNCMDGNMFPNTFETLNCILTNKTAQRQNGSAGRDHTPQSLPAPKSERAFGIT